MRILYGTDGSEGARRALELVVGSLDSGRVDVHALSVMPRLDVPSLAAGFLDARTEAVGAAQARLESAGFRCHTTVAVGHAAETIVATANDERPDLVVVGTHGLTGLERLIIGSVSGRAATYAHVSVLVARNAGPVRNVLVGYDGSEAADRALDQFISLPFKSIEHVIVCAAYDVHAPLSSGLAPLMLREAELAFDEATEVARTAAEAAVARAAGRLREHGLDTETTVVRGRARDVLATMARDRGADLVVVGSRGVSAIERFLLGSTSAALVGAPVTSVLVGRGGIAG